MKNILISEDNITLAFEWRDIFELNGHAVTLCHNAVDAAVLLENTKFDLVITDMFMPGGKGGLHVIGAMILMGEAAPPAIAVTGQRSRSYPTDETNLFLHQAKRLGASAALEKPFAAAELLAVAQRLWDNEE